MFTTPHAQFSQGTMNPAARPAVARRAALGLAMITVLSLLLIAIIITTGAGAAWAQTEAAGQKLFQVPAGDMEALNLFAQQE